MTTPFKNTLRSLQREPRRLTAVSCGLLMVLIAAWLAVALTVPVPVHVISTQARLITSERPMPVHAPVALPVRRMLVDLGDRVSAGELLIELDAGSLPIEIARAESSLAANGREITALRQQLAARQDMLLSKDEAAAANAQRISAELAAAAEELQLAKRESSRAERLGSGGNLSAAELERRRTRVAEAGSRVSALEATRRRERADAAVFAAEQRAAIAALDRELADRQATIAELEARLESLRTALSRTRVVAPVSGTIAALAPLGPGAVVESSDWLLTLVPDTRFEVEAQFDGQALGQLRRGQTGRLRLDSFPWASYGLVAAKLSRLGVDTEANVALARFEIDPEASADIPLQNGLVGQLEVEVRRVPPAVLLLEVIGRLGSNAA